MLAPISICRFDNRPGIEAWRPRTGGLCTPAQPPTQSATAISGMGSRMQPAFKLHRRFDRTARLIGDAGMERLWGAHVIVFGLGGVGSYAVEGLVRSGVGHLT